MIRRRNLLTAAIVMACTAIAVPVVYHFATARLNELLLSRAESAIELEDFAAAESYAARAWQRAPSRRAAMLAGEAAMLQGRHRQAIKYLQPLLDETDDESLLAINAVAELYMRLGDARQAEHWFRRVLEIDAANTFARRGLVSLLTLQGRRRESLPLRFGLLLDKEIDVEDLLLLGNPRALLEGDELTWFEQIDSENPMWWLARGQLALRNSRSQEAIRLLRRVVAAVPEYPDGQAELGLALLDAATPEEFWAWHEQVPADAELHCDLWVARGLWAQRNNQPQAAVRCFWEALRREPTHRLASYQLAVALVADGQPELATRFERLSVKLLEITAVIDRLFTREREQISTMQEAARRLEELGRYWEAIGWHNVILLKDPRGSNSPMELIRLMALVDRDFPRIDPELNPAEQVDFSSYPLPRIERPAAVGPLAINTSGNDAIHFADVTASAGLDFAYFNGEDPETEGRRMFEFTGGGVAVLDYDLDGWPDLYFTQGIHWPRREGQSVWRDQLYRNLGDGRLENVTEAAGLGDDLFGQGVAAGDFNNDGYPDLYVGNVGANRLYLNNGDGTFTEVTDQAGVAADIWSTSCLIADIDGDGIPDLYSVNYLAGSAPELMCRRTCSPAQFDAAADQFFQGQGDGTFIDRSVEAGFIGEDGKGLAVLAFDFNDTGQLSLFVANDTTANFFYVNEQSRGAPPQFTETAMLRGLAFDREGQAQACMGIGVSDSNGDGLLDVFVANFYREFNVLYEQMPGGFFADVSRERGLAEPSYLLLTFGAAFADVDLDGYPDIIATNGHVDDFRDEGVPYHMPPRVFRNLQGHYVELGDTCGPFFQKGYLGRGLATLDWNRDGKMDWAVSHLDSPAALLENRTEPAGNFLGLTFTGRTCERNAFGTTCWVTVGDRTTVHQLIPGGYHNTNEPLMLVGLGAANQADQLEVRWPSGLRQVFENVPAQSVYRLIEGHDSLYTRPRD